MTQHDQSSRSNGFPLQVTTFSYSEVLESNTKKTWVNECCFVAIHIKMFFGISGKLCYCYCNYKFALWWLCSAMEIFFFVYKILVILYRKDWETFKNNSAHLLIWNLTGNVICIVSQIICQVTDLLHYNGCWLKWERQLSDFIHLPLQWIMCHKSNCRARGTSFAAYGCKEYKKVEGNTGSRLKLSLCVPHAYPLTKLQPCD